MPQSMDKTLAELNSSILALRKQLPSYVFLVALSQLSSRICHSHPTVARITRDIVQHVAEAYPNQVSQTLLKSRQKQRLCFWFEH